MKKKEQKEFPCYNCANANPLHKEYCEFTWDEYNRKVNIWDCLGSK